MENDSSEKIVRALEDKDWNEEKVLFNWEASERAYKKRDRDFWITIIAILVLVSVILFLVKEFFLIGALISALFLYYVLSSVPPQDIKYKLTNRGVYYGEVRYTWDTFERFWIRKELNNSLIHFETILRFPRQISLVFNPDDQEKIKNIAIKYLPMIDESPNFTDKLTKKVISWIPLEKKNLQKIQQLRKKPNF